MNKSIVSERLENEFKTKSFPLSKDAIITKDKDAQWKITDKKIYIVRKEDGKLNVYDVKRTVTCPDPKCKEEIPLREVKTKCPCGHVNDVLIPEGTQILETHYLDTPCKKCDREERKNKRENNNIYWTKCYERPKEANHIHFREVEALCESCKGKFHIILIRGVKSVCLLTGGEECRGVNQNILGWMASGFGELVHRVYMWAQKRYFGGCTPFLGPYGIKRLGEFAYCIGFGIILAAIGRLSIFLLFDFLEKNFFTVHYFSWRSFWWCFVFFVLSLKGDRYRVW